MEEELLEQGEDLVADDHVAERKSKKKVDEKDGPGMAIRERLRNAMDGSGNVVRVRLTVVHVPIR
jgi:hypothetical protein